MIGVIKSDIRYDVFKGDDKYIVSNHINDFVDIDVVILPFLGIDSYYNIIGTKLNLIDILRQNQVLKIFTGLANKTLKELCMAKDIELYEMLKDEVFVIDNSLLTAAGIIDYLQKKGQCVNDMCIFIMGYGNISSSLARLLKAYNTDFVIYPNNEMERKFILLDQYKLGDISDLKKYNVVINTIPYNYIGDYNVFKDTSIIDFESKTYVFDVVKLMDLNIEYNVYSSIPSKYLATSAGKLVFNFVEKHLKI